MTIAKINSGEMLACVEVDIMVASHKYILFGGVGRTPVAVDARDTDLRECGGEGEPGYLRQNSRLTGSRKQWRLCTRGEAVRPANG